MDRTHDYHTTSPHTNFFFLRAKVLLRLFLWLFRRSHSGSAASVEGEAAKRNTMQPLAINGTLTCSDQQGFERAYSRSVCLGWFESETLQQANPTFHIKEWYFLLRTIKLYDFMVSESLWLDVLRRKYHCLHLTYVPTKTKRRSTSWVFLGWLTCQIELIIAILLIVKTIDNSIRKIPSLLWVLSKYLSPFQFRDAD